MMFALAMGIVTAHAQENVTVAEENNGSEQQTDAQPVLTKEVYPQKEADGDLYHGLTKKLTFDRMIPPHGLEGTYDKTVHIIFPAEVRYVDLGSPDLIAGKADGAENVIRVKATVRNFPNETNMSVITEDGSFYTFNVKYAAEPLLLNVEMCDFIHDGESVNRPNNAQEIYLKELGSESPMLVRLIMKSIHKQNKREVKHIGCKRFGIQYLLKGIYTHNGLLYFHTEIKNQSNVPFDVDYITWKIVDKKVAKRTAMQEQIILPLRAQNYATLVPGKKSERTVFTMAKFTKMCIRDRVWSVWNSYRFAEKQREKIYVLDNGKSLMLALSQDLSQNRPAEAREHVRRFHELFFTLSPEKSAIEHNVKRALLLADKSVYHYYSDFAEKGYYNRIIAGNINQVLKVDSVVCDFNAYPYRAVTYATQKIIRQSNVTERSLVTTCRLLNASRSDDNPNGFTIEGFTIIENKDLQTIKR